MRPRLRRRRRPIVVPAVADPIVSVVIVTRDAWEWIDRCLRALVAHTPPVYEVIVVDNASGPDTVARLEAVDGIRLLRNDSNRGFGPANNQGAALARGRLLLLLNSDAFVDEGWLDPLLEVIDSDPAVGAVGPRAMNLDGSLQEAGAVLARDGTAAKLGDGGSSDAPEHLFRRRVDFAGAQCLLVRRDAYEAAGGFDDAYAPAYYEDADLCLALAARGLHTLYEPRSVVTHVKFGSGAAASAEALSARNRVLFAQRWAGVLAGRPPSVDPARARSLIEARDAPAPARVLAIGVDLGGLAPPADVRVTAAVSGDLGVLRARGVEAMPEPADWDHWLAARRYFYDVVFMGPGAAPEAAAAVRATQPQALLRDASALDDAGLSAALADAGVYLAARR